MVGVSPGASFYIHTPYQKQAVPSLDPSAGEDDCGVCVQWNRKALKYQCSAHFQSVDTLSLRVDIIHQIHLALKLGKNAKAGSQARGWCCLTQMTAR